MSEQIKKTIGFVTFEKWHNKPDAGSSRIRGHWLIKYWPEAEVFQQGKKYEIIILQKVYWPGYCEVFDGIKILDLCDPDWLAGIDIKKSVDSCDVVTTSTEALRDVVKQFTDKPVVFISDRQDLEFHDKQKVHKGRAERVCWHGYSHNASTLDKAVGLIRKHKLELVVISDMRPPYPRASENVKWELETVNEEILKCDFMVIPPDSRPRGQYKSNNKVTKAWALGMPVARTPEDLERFLDPEERKKEAELRLKEVREKWDVRLSVKEFQNLIEKIRRERNGDKK